MPASAGDADPGSASRDPRPATRMESRVKESNAPTSRPRIDDDLALLIRLVDNPVHVLPLPQILLAHRFYPRDLVVAEPFLNVGDKVTLDFGFVGVEEFGKDGAVQGAQGGTVFGDGVRVRVRWRGRVEGKTVGLPARETAVEDRDLVVTKVLRAATPNFCQLSLASLPRGLVAANSSPPKLRSVVP